MKKTEGRARVIISGVKPEIDSGLYPAKRIIGEKVVVEADIFADGHDALTAILLYRKEENADWIEIPMEYLDNDRWQGSFLAAELGHYRYTIKAWIDRFNSWRQDMKKRESAGQEDIDVNLLEGAKFITEASRRASKTDRQIMQDWAKTLSSSGVPRSEKIKQALSQDVATLMQKYSDRKFAVAYPRELLVLVDRQKALFSSWYEMFPRSCAREAKRHGTFKDCEARLPYIAEMGFDVLYFPPVHPIGSTFRKGKNNAIQAGADDPGTPWAIGAEEGGHKSVHPKLGTLEDFRQLVEKAQEYGIEIAMDIAFQCSPDHPYVKEHPEWFVWRQDGTIQYAENPPKKYQDIYPLNFESDHWTELWEELKTIILHWTDQGIRIFRVDNPHTKTFRFWEWLIAEVKKVFPDTIFLAEAFTRPKIMHQLAKLGFTQSYTYFAWRNTKKELTQYLTELTRTELAECYRPNFWPNTPDILNEYLQSGGRPAFMSRLVLAATMAASYGIYGPAFELCINTAKELGSEEYLDSEKYEVKHWDVNEAGNIKDFIARVNQIRRENPALQNNSNLWFHAIDNEELICFSKHTEDLSNIILVVVNLNPHYTHSGWIHLPLEPWELHAQRPFQVHDLLSGARYLWHGAGNYVELNPSVCPAHIFRVHPRMRREEDFDYYF